MLRKLINPYVGQDGYLYRLQPWQSYWFAFGILGRRDEIVTEWSPSANYQGWVNTLHGGIISTLVDEIAGWVVSRKLQTAGMTTSLNVKFLKPVYTTEPKITLRASIANRRRNFVVIHVTLTNSRGEVCDEGDATYYAFDHERAKEMKFTACKVEGEE